MGFEDELADIVQNALHEKEHSSDKPMDVTLEKIRAKGTDSYLVFMTEDGENGLITLGNKASLSLLHRVADRLIDTYIYDDFG